MISMVRPIFQMEVRAVTTRLSNPVAMVALRTLSTSLHDIVRRGDLSQLKESLEKASIEEVNARNSKGEIPLCIALQNYNNHTHPYYSPKIITLLIRSGACIMRQQKDGTAALHLIKKYDGYLRRVLSVQGGQKHHPITLPKMIDVLARITLQQVSGCSPCLKDCTNRED
ncbi:MAG: hypothetical protein KBC64_00885 [Simkaniaceae bacterium]|nr:hypothetical protein [Simkaniaceae bacterium]